jgi:hypothetical protein
MAKRILLLLAVALVLPAFAAAEAWSDVSMIDSQCSAKVKADPDAHTRQCALMCEKAGFGIVDSSGNYLKFDDKGNQEALKLLHSSSKKDHIRVNVTGSKDGNVIHVESLRML